MEIVEPGSIPFDHVRILACAVLLEVGFCNGEKHRPEYPVGPDEVFVRSSLPKEQVVDVRGEVEFLRARHQV